MAGNYPDVPSWRMAWDRDGTQAFACDVGFTQVNSQLTHADILSLNRETSLTFSMRNKGTFIAFPEIRDLDGVWTYSSHSQLILSQVSADTTNGIDGTWVNYPLTTSPSSGKTSMRGDIATGTALAIRGYRISFGDSSGSIANGLHLYGEPSPGENLKRTEIWHPTLDQRAGAAYFDWGNVPRSSTADLPFRVKNMHGTLTAEDIRVAMDALTDATPSVPGQHSISQDGGVSFAAQQTIGDLAPGAISSQLILRRITPSDAMLALWWHRMFAEPLSWA